MERIGRLGVGFGGVDLRALIILSCPSVTSMNGALDRSDRCELLVGFVSGNYLVREFLSCGATGQFLACLELFSKAL
jgi:hypothetical protein